MPNLSKNLFSGPLKLIDMSVLRVCDEANFSSGSKICNLFGRTLQHKFFCKVLACFSVSLIVFII